MNVTFFGKKFEKHFHLGNFLGWLRYQSMRIFRICYTKIFYVMTNVPSQSTFGKCLNKIHLNPAEPFIIIQTERTQTIFWLPSATIWVYPEVEVFQFRSFRSIYRYRIKYVDPCGMLNYLAKNIIYNFKFFVNIILKIPGKGTQQKLKRKQVLRDCLK